jgi:multimeric flavodoxin WrbA
MSKIVIVFHSGYGHTKKIAEAVAEGSGGALLAIDAEGNLPEGGWEQLAGADKKFADTSSKARFTMAWKNKIAAGFTNSATLNGDKFSSLMYMFTLSQQHGMVWVGMGMQGPNAKHHTRDDLNNLGGYSGLITTTPSDASPDEMVPGDLATARAFGKRIADVTARIGTALR